MPNASASIKIRPPQFKVETSVLPSAALELIKQHNNSDDGRPSVSSVVESALEKASEQNQVINDLYGFLSDLPISIDQINYAFEVIKTLT
ncbi:MAG: hypothetical protein VX781_07745 [Pseudomonadota bacterium]|nr:hypothetical protein [Pseudomonadota bacterium]|tara:strand:- start:313 stop:582 length:270 start_codon:yes stop_codon:yes gene_type:complete